MSENNNFDCIICFEPKSNNEKILSPCAHGPYCESCYNNLTRSTGICAICRHTLNPIRPTTNNPNHNPNHNINHRNLIRQNPILTNLDSNEFNLQNIDHNQFSTINSSDHNLTLPETNTLRFSGVSPFNSTFMSMIRDMQQSNSTNGFRN
jgi:hypothetical protein